MTSESDRGDGPLVCASCNSPLALGVSPAGLCARCLLATALASDRDDALADDTTRTTLEAGTMVGLFRIVRVVGRGGMSTVYEARDGRLERAIALKVLPPEFLHDPKFAERFEREARVVAALEHPNIVPIHASGIDGGIPWMSMRLLTGGTIGTLLERGAPTPARIVQLLRPVASALDYAHTHGVVHRDIKPTNVLLDDSDGVCVGDFGLAYMIEVSSRMTQAGLLAGTPEYMAPEQALGKPVDHRCDIYSLSMVAYEMFAGAPPFTGASPVAILFKHVHDPLPEPASGTVPPAIMRVIHKGAAKEPARRWSSATAFVDALDEAISARPLNRRPILMASIGAAVILSVVTAGWFVARESPPAVQRNPAVVAAPAATKVVESVPTAAPIPERTASAPAPRLPAPRPPPNVERAPDTPTDPGPPQQPAVQPLAVPIAVDVVEPPPPPQPASDRERSADGPPPSPDVVVSAPTRLRTVNPEYPQVAQAAQLEGEVLLEAVVTPEGTVTNVKIVRSVHPLLDDAARKAVMQYEYEPARRNGVPEAALVRLTVLFRLR